MMQQLNFPTTIGATTYSPAAATKKTLKPPPHLVPLSSRITTNPLSKPKPTEIPSPSPDLPPPRPNPPLPATYRRANKFHVNEKDEFQEKALFLDSIGVDSLSVIDNDPTLLATTSIHDLKLLTDYLSYNPSLSFPAAELRRIIGMCPDILSLRLRDAASVCSFLIREARVSACDLRRVINRRPRLLVCSISDRLRPTLYFLQSIGIEEVNKHTDLLSCCVEDKFMPRIEYFQKLGFSYSDTIVMFRRFPALFCYSIKKNFEPKLNYFVVEMGRELKELQEFPQYFSFSLEKRIKPRHQLCLEKGIYFPLNVMLKPSEDEFTRRMNVCVDSSLPLRNSPLWCAAHQCDDADALDKLPL